MDSGFRRNAGYFPGKSISLGYNKKNSKLFLLRPFSEYIQLLRKKLPILDLVPESPNPEFYRMISCQAYPAAHRPPV
jgi:hypothetical protein